MKWERIRPYVLGAATAVILGQGLLIVDFHLRLDMVRGSADAWYDTAGQLLLRAEEWEVSARRLAAINHTCTAKLHSYREFVSQIFDPRLHNEIPLKPLDLIEAPAK